MRVMVELIRGERPGFKVMDELGYLIAGAKKRRLGKIQS
jgi:hypothetical protein